MGLQTSVPRNHLHVEMTVWKTVKNRSNVKLKTKHIFLQILTRWARICGWFVDLSIISYVIDVITVILHVFRWGTLMVVISKQFSSNWQIVFLGWWVCMGLHTSFLRYQLLVEMTVWKTVTNRSNVKLKTEHIFLQVLTRWTRICAWFSKLIVIFVVIVGQKSAKTKSTNSFQNLWRLGKYIWRNELVPKNVPKSMTYPG